MDKAVLQIALETVNEKIKTLQEAAKELKRQISGENSKPKRKGKKETQTDHVVQLFRDEKRALSTTGIEELLRVRGTPIPITSLRSLLNREEGKLFEKSEQRDGRSVVWMLKELAEEKKRAENLPLS